MRYLGSVKIRFKLGASVITCIWSRIDPSALLSPDRPPNPSTPLPNPCHPPKPMQPALVLTADPDPPSTTCAAARGPISTVTSAPMALRLLRYRRDFNTRTQCPGSRVAIEQRPALFVADHHVDQTAVKKRQSATARPVE